MTKTELNVWCGAEEEYKHYQPSTLKKIISYLRERGIRIYAFFEFEKPDVIIKYKGMICHFENSSKACEYLIDIYTTLMQKEKEDLINRKLMRELMIEEFEYEQRKKQQAYIQRLPNY